MIGMCIWLKGVFDLRGWLAGVFDRRVCDWQACLSDRRVWLTCVCDQQACLFGRRVWLTGVFDWRACLIDRRPVRAWAAGAVGEAGAGPRVPAAGNGRQDGRAARPDQGAEGQGEGRRRDQGDGKRRVVRAGGTDDWRSWFLLKNLQKYVLIPQKKSKWAVHRFQDQCYKSCTLLHVAETKLNRYAQNVALFTTIHELCSSHCSSERTVVVLF